MTCRVCKAPNPTAAGFCGQCGSQLSPTMSGKAKAGFYVQAMGSARIDPNQCSGNRNVFPWMRRQRGSADNHRTQSETQFRFGVSWRDAWS